jgi:hypothetical protein
MKEKPILFSTPMTQALLNTKPGTWPPEPVDASKPFKYMTRRVVKPQPKHTLREKNGRWYEYCERPPADKVCNSPWGYEYLCPYAIGQILWVRETWLMADDGFHYKANATPESEVLRKNYGYKWRPSIFMPREVARIFLEVKAVRVERVQDITEEDARAEGVGREWLLNDWMEPFKYASYANWFYYDPEKRYWCDKHIEAALKQFKRDVRRGNIEIDELKELPMKSVMEEINNYCRDYVEEEHPIFCETCGEPLSFLATKNLIDDDDFDEYLDRTWDKNAAPLISSLLCNYEEEFFSKPNIYRLMFRALWDSINAKRGYSWESNPYVYVYEFMRVK